MWRLNENTWEKRVMANRDCYHNEGKRVGVYCLLANNLRTWRWEMNLRKFVGFD